MKKLSAITYFILTFSSIMLSSCSENDTSTVNTIPDNQTITINGQTWMQKNLNVSTYRNGDPIPEITDPIEWSTANTGAWCYYNNDPSSEAIYGKLYNWFAVNDPRGLAPDGYHVANFVEWKNLIFDLGGEDIAGGAMKTTTGWLNPNFGANNTSGFSALPGGFRNGKDGITYGSNSFGSWWTSTERMEINGEAFIFYLLSNSASIFPNNVSMRDGYSVRCVKDVNEDPNSITIKIGSQVWMKKNLDVTNYRDNSVIPQAMNISEWTNYANSGTGAWCYIDFNPANAIYGKLYNWYAVNNPIGLAPLNYHIPSDEEWNILSNFLQDDVGTRMKARTGWTSPLTTATNISGFTGLKTSSFGASWWSSSASSTSNNNALYLELNDFNFSGLETHEGAKSLGLSVRCIKNL